MPTPPPQGEFPDQSTYLTTEPNTSSHVGPEPQVIPDSPSEGVSRAESDLRIPSINVTAGTPPLSLSETGFVVEQSEANSSLNEEGNNDTSVTEDTTSVTEDASLTEGTSVCEGTSLTEDTMTTTSVTHTTNSSEGSSVTEASGLTEKTSLTREETKEASATIGTSSTPSLSEVASLTEVVSLTEAATLPDGKMKRQSSERRFRPQAGDKSTRRRARSSERGSDNKEPLRVTRTTGSSSERMSRRRSADVSTLVQRHTANKSPDAVLPKSTEHHTISEVNKSDSDGEQSTLLPSPAHRNTEESPSLNSSPSSTSSLASVPTAEEHVVAPSDHPPCTLGEKVMVETSVGFKFGKVKFIGPTEFSAGEWIGIALERPLGELAS